jgi:hypothetical protein
VRILAPSPKAAVRLAAAIASATRAQGGTPCRVCSLPNDVRAVVDEALTPPPSERRVSLVQLAGLLKEQGHPVGETSLQKHGVRHIRR